MTPSTWSKRLLLLQKRLEGPALTFSAALTDTYLEKLRGESDEASQRWQVYAELD
jgi:hypothetical protein